MRSPSEHTVNGAHYDLEMQIYHDAETTDESTGETSTKHSAISIMFSVEDYDDIEADTNKTLQDFFRQF